MSPALLIPNPSFTVEPLVKRKDQKLNFSAIVSSNDLHTVSVEFHEDVAKLKETIWTHKVIIVKGQKNLDPQNHWKLVTQLDPEAPQVHSHGNLEEFAKKGSILSKARDIYGIPGAENVRLIGKGFQSKDHYGLKNLNIQGLSNDFHATRPSDQDFNQVITRFQRWHIDAPLYARNPAWFTTLRSIKLSTSPDVTIRWDDASGLEMKSRSGLTAFFSASQLYDMLSEDEQKMAYHNWVEYAPHPYMWIENCKANSTGLGLVNQNKEHALAELGEFEESKIKRYPLVWVNPSTGEKAFQVHGICARKLFLRSSPDEEPRVIEDTPDIRSFYNEIQSRVLRPEFIWLPEVEEGDMVIWDNYGCFHSAVDYLLQKYGPRTRHQANIGASKGPVGPTEVPVFAGAKHHQSYSSRHPELSVLQNTVLP